MMKSLPFQSTDPARSDFQFLEDLATAYWYSEVLFAALDAKVFDHLDAAGKALAPLAEAVSCDAETLMRLLTMLQRLELVGHADGIWFNQPLASRFLVSDQPDYLGHLLLYRRYMKTGWEGLTGKLTGDRASQGRSLNASDDYALRNFHYVRAMDALARQKAEEIVRRIPGSVWHAPILDIGGGAGALSRAMVRRRQASEAWLLELPEVLQAAEALYPNPGDWDRMHTIAADFRHHPFDAGQQFGMVVLGNFLHAYGAGDARRLLEKAVSLLSSDGLLVVHDYCPDRMDGPVPQKGALYDLCMMLNTYDGRCHSADAIREWIEAAGMTEIATLDLETDSCLILASRNEGALSAIGSEEWAAKARALGFRHAHEIETDRIVLAHWTTVKCRFGCARYGGNLQCPPNGMDIGKTRALLEDYSRALLVEGAPPGKHFHDGLLALERQAFLAGYHKALAFGAGPCPVCKTCPDDGPCLQPEKARPSMEGAGMDVYATARNAGISIAPVVRKGDYVKYIGLLLLE